ncbi:uncharacterized protein LOC132556749 [Ylistrum balloti]|uniref:uncharacterized protein LOC132556749 n=1 Tax=Ylistrum balloti TaxID=509963 RepID=UPI002905F295|nr:uncharacterized protein LOC132556749 [Ylistrum balloti]
MADDKFAALAHNKKHAILDGMESNNTKRNTLIEPRSTESRKCYNECKERQLWSKDCNIRSSSCPSHAKVFVQLVGQNVVSNYYMIKVFSSGRFLLQRGNKDILLIRTKEYLGPVEEVKVVVSGLKTVSWRPNSVSVTCMTSGEAYFVDCRLLNANNTATDGDDYVFFADNRKSWSCHAILRRIATFHPWLSPFNVPLRFGKFTSVVSTSLVFLALTLLMTLTLVGYILTVNNAADIFCLEIDFVIMTVVVEVAVSLVMYLLNILLRNVKSGKKEVIDKLFPKSDNIYHSITNQESYVEKQGNNEKKSNSQVSFSITNFSSAQSRSSLQNAKISDNQISDTNFKSFISLSLLQPEQSDNDQLEINIPESYQRLGEHVNTTEVGSIQDISKTKDLFKSNTGIDVYDVEGEDRDVFRSSTNFEIHPLEGDSHEVDFNVSDEGRLNLEMNTSFLSLDQFRYTEQDSNNSADKDSQNTNTRKKSGGTNTKSSVEDEEKYAYGGKRVNHDPAKKLTRPYNADYASKISVFNTEMLEESPFLDIESESDAFLDVADSEFEITQQVALHSVSDEWQSSVDVSMKPCAYSRSLPCNHTVKQRQTLEPAEGNVLPEGYVDGAAQDTFNKTKKCIQSSFSRPKTKEYAGGSLSKSNERGYQENIFPKSNDPFYDHNAYGQAQDFTEQKQYTKVVPVKNVSPESTTVDTREELLSHRQVSLEMNNIDESRDEAEYFFEIENKLSDHQHSSISFDRQSTNSEFQVKDETTGPRSVLLPQRQTNSTSSESDEVQQQIHRRSMQLQVTARTLSSQLLLHLCETRRLLHIHAHFSTIYNKTKSALNTWITNVTEEQVFSVLLRNRILAIQKDPLAVKISCLGNEVLEWSKSKILGEQCIRQFIQLVCEVMALPRHPNFRQRLERQIQDTLTHHLHNFTQQFFDHLNQSSKWTTLWQSISNEDSIADNLVIPHLPVSQSAAAVLQRRENASFPKSVVSKSAEDTRLHELSSYYIDCVQRCILKNEGNNFSVSVIPMPTCSTVDQDEVQVLLNPVKLSKSFMELSLESQLYRTALDRAMKELWLEYQDPIPVYTAFLMQAVTLDKLKTRLNWSNDLCAYEEIFPRDSQSIEILNVKQNVHENKSGNSYLEDQSVEDEGQKISLRATPSEKLARFSGIISRKLSLVRKSKMALITLLSKKSDTKESSETKETVELHPLIPCLDKRWHQLGFHHSLNVNKNLAQALMTKLVKEEQHKPTPLTENLVLGNISCLYRIERELYGELEKNAATCFERWCPYIQQIAVDCGTNTERARDQVCAVVDVASKEMLASLDSIIRDTVSREFVNFTATQAMQNSVSKALDTLKTPVADESETVTSYEIDTAELIKDFLPLRRYLTGVTKWERLISRELVQANFRDRYKRKHNNFALITLQHVLDSYSEKDPDMLDTTLTNDNLQQLEWNILQENTKMIPSCFGRLTTFVLFCLTVFCLVYVTLIGGSLTVTQIQEWMSCFCIGVALYGFVIEPFVAVVGYLSY